MAFPFIRTLAGALGLLALAAQAAPPTIKTTPSGISVDGGKAGGYEFAYPVLLDEQQHEVHKLIEAKPTGTASTVKYADGAQLNVAVKGSEIELKFTQLPADARHFRMEMLLDIALSKGGKWKMGDKDGVFPPEKPASPHFAQGNANTFSFISPQGGALAFTIPQYGFQQLTDNRQWKWQIFRWMFLAPLQPGATEAKIAVSTEGGGKAVVLADEFGQSLASTWPDKIKSLAELKADVETEKAYYASFTPPKLDRFGGLPESAAKLGLRATGFFHVERHAAKWWLVDPEGNAFFQLGVCGFNPSDDYTYTQGREDSYEWLPAAKGEYESAFRLGDPAVVSFHLLNTIKKYGQPYSRDVYVARMIDRVRAWGFNSGGAFSEAPTAAHVAASFPYVGHLPMNEWEGVPRVPGIAEAFDPFDPASLAKIEENMAKTVATQAKDPLLIGWFIVNEPRFDEIPKAVPALDGKHACKRRLVQMLSEKYKSIDAYNTAWQAQAKSFEDLNNAGLSAKTDEARADLTAFTGLFLDTYFKFVSETYRRNDANHLLLGGRFQPITIENEQLCRIVGRYVDVMSFNYYTYGVDRDLLQRIYGWSGERPMLLSEFFWSAPKESGLTAGWDVQTQQERGFMYRDYLEQSAAFGFVVGIEWFTLVDQSLTGRWFSKYSGESANTGLIAVTDRPWKPMIAEMVKSNYEIYAVLQGERAPFSWTDPRFRRK